MKNSVRFLIISAVFLTVAGLVVWVSAISNKSSAEGFKDASVSDFFDSQSVLSIFENEVDEGEIFSQKTFIDFALEGNTLEVRARSGDNKLRAVELKIQFDPIVVLPGQIETGNAFDLYLNPEVDLENGVIKIVAALPNDLSAEGRLVAKVPLTKLTSDTSVIRLLSSEDLGKENVSKIVLDSSTQLSLYPAVVEF